MKNFILIIISGFTFLFVSTSCSSSVKDGKNISFKVYGNCNMCKKTIEGSLKDVAGIAEAEWNKDSKIMQVAYDSSKISDREIHKKIAAAGYDTELEKGNDAAYNELHECCRYERKK